MKDVWNPPHLCLFDHDRKIFTVKIPKAASSWLVTLFNNIPNKRMDVEDYLAFRDPIEKFKDYKFIAMIRDPVDRYASMCAETFTRQYQKINTETKDLIGYNISDEWQQQFKIDFDQWFSGKKVSDIIEFMSLDPVHKLHFEPQVYFLADIEKYHENIVWFEVDYDLSSNVKLWMLTNDIAVFNDPEEFGWNRSQNHPFRKFIKNYVTDLIETEHGYREQIQDYYRSDMDHYHEKLKLCYRLGE